MRTASWPQHTVVSRHGPCPPATRSPRKLRGCWRCLRFGEEQRRTAGAMLRRGMGDVWQAVADVPEEWHKSMAFSVAAGAAAAIHLLIDCSTMPFLSMLLWLGGYKTVALAAVASARSTQRIL